MVLNKKLATEEDWLSNFRRTGALLLTSAAVRMAISSYELVCEPFFQIWDQRIQGKSGSSRHRSYEERRWQNQSPNGHDDRHELWSQIVTIFRYLNIWSIDLWQTAQQRKRAGLLWELLPKCHHLRGVVARERLELSTSGL